MAKSNYTSTHSNFLKILFYEIMSSNLGYCSRSIELKGALFFFPRLNHYRQLSLYFIVCVALRPTPPTHLQLQ